MFTYILFALALTIDLNVISPVIRSCMQSAIKSATGIVSISISRIITHVSRLTTNEKSLKEGLVIIEDGSIKDVVLAMRCINPSSLWSTTIVLAKSDNILVSVIHDLLGVKFVCVTRSKSINPMKSPIITSLDNIHWRSELCREFGNKANSFVIVNGEPRPFELVDECVSEHQLVQER